MRDEGVGLAGIPEMRLRTSDPAAAPDLLAFLRERVDCIAEEVAPGEIEVSILGSRTVPYSRRELDNRLRPWRAARPDVDVLVIDLDVGDVAPSRPVLVARGADEWTPAPLREGADTSLPR